MKTPQAANNENSPLIHHAEKRLVRVARSADKRLWSIKGSESSLNLLIYLPFPFCWLLDNWNNQSKFQIGPLKTQRNAHFQSKEMFIPVIEQQVERSITDLFKKKSKNNCLSIPGTFLELDQTFLVKTPMWIGSFWFDQTRKFDSIPFKFRANQFKCKKSSQVPPVGLELNFYFKKSQK